MNEYKCPRCSKELSDDEIKNKICFECGSLLSVKTKSKRIKACAGYLKDTRNINYRFWIRFFYFILIFASCLTLVAIFLIFPILRGWVSFVILAVLIILYILVVSFVQFLISVVRDVYILKKKLSADKKYNEKE